MSTRGELIITLHQAGKTTREICDLLYGTVADWKERDRRMAYIRVVVRQRKGTKRSRIDRKYLANGGQERHNDIRRIRYNDDANYRNSELRRGAEYRERTRDARNAERRRRYRQDKHGVHAT